VMELLLDCNSSRTVCDEVSVSESV